MAKDLWKGNDSITGAALYVDNCAACHRTDGAGYKRAFPSLKGNPVVQTEDATSLIHIVLTGSTTPAVKDAVSNLTMPSFGWRLDDQQVADVVNFIRTSWGNNAPAVSASDVAKVRKETAAHDEKALGNADISKLPGPDSNRQGCVARATQPILSDDVKYCLNQGVCLHAACRATDLHR